MSDRKYRQRGYQQDSGKPEKKERPKQPSGPRSKHDMLGPRTPRMVGSVTRARCSTCGAVLAPGFDPSGNCPRCKADLHACKQCRFFDTGARFECMQPVPERITKKDLRNNCTFFEFRTTIEKDTSPAADSTSQSPAASPQTPNSARKAFDDLFKD